MARYKKYEMSKVVVNGNTVISKDTWLVANVPESVLADVSEPVEAPEPDFSEIKKLLSDKPLEFNPSRKSRI